MATWREVSFFVSFFAPSSWRGVAAVTAVLDSVAMSFVIALLVGGLAAFLLFRARKKSEHEVARDTTTALDAFIAEALENELAGPVLGIRGASAEERRPLTKTLRNEPDPDVVTKIEAAVRTVELEFVKYAHDTDAEVTVRVRYDDGNKGETSKRMAWSDVPEAVRAEFDKKGGTRVFRAWSFPWQRVSAL